MSSDNLQQNYRDVMRRYPSGVTVVTSTSGNSYYGGTMNSFTSVSVSPPTVAVFFQLGSKTLDAILKTKKFCINLLSDHQEREARDFANPQIEDKFRNVGFSLAENGSPLIDGCFAYLECDLERSFEISDHVMILGLVTRAKLQNDSGPLVYYNRAFQAI